MREGESHEKMVVITSQTFKQHELHNNGFLLVFRSIVHIAGSCFWGLVIGCALSVLLNSMIGTNWRSSKFQF